MNRSCIITIYLILVVIFETNFLISFPENISRNIRDGIIILFIILSLWSFINNKIQDKFLRVHLLLYLVYYLFLIIESLIKYNSIMIYPHVIFTLSSFFYTIGFYILLSKVNISLFLTRLCYFSCGYIYFQEIVYRIYHLNIYGVAPASTVYLLLFTTLYFIFNYIQKPSLYKIIIIFINLFLIIIENHRTVWISSIVNILLLIPFIKTHHIKRTASSIAIFIIILFLSLFLFKGNKNDTLFEDKKEMEFSFQERIEDIYKFKEQGTGKWRYNIYEYYLPYIKNNLIFGTRFRGFNMPSVYATSFGEKTGHHFHSSYLPILFYHGLLGLYLLYYPVIYYLYKLLKNKEKLNKSIFLYSFIFSGLFFSISYRLPLFYYGILGLNYCIICQKENL